MDGTSYALSSLSAGVTYKFKVAAINIAGTGTFTSEFEISTTAAIRPDPPTDLTETVSSKTFDQVEFSWTPPANNGGAAISGYEI